MSGPTTVDAGFPAYTGTREAWAYAILDYLAPKLAAKGIVVLGHSTAGLAEEAPGAYKDVDEVVGVMHETGIARKVVRVLPLVNVKG